MSLETDIALAHRLADAAGAAIRPLFRSDWSHEAKADASPVTEADRAAEAAMRKLLDAEAPRDGIIGEEYGAERADAARQWVLDPIDTLFNGHPATTRACRNLADAVLATTGPQYFSDHDGEHFMALAAQTAHKRMVFGGDCYNYGLLASGHIDLVVEAGLKLHDYAALVPIVEGAGGTMCDWNGDPLHADSSGHVIALGDPARLEDVIEGLACHH